MTENLIEQIVSKCETKAVKFLKIFMVVLTVLVAVLYLPVGLIMALIIYLVFGRMNIEYEYTFFMGDLEVAKVTNKSTRKKLFAVNMKDVEVVAPKGAYELKGYQQIKAIRCTTSSPESKIYELISKQGEGKERLVFEPSEELLLAMQRIEPRKVIF